ncbi:MAG: succinate--CoA ligase subunit alpha [Candidatus Aegiribacteria sp.]|nr:succinate--CoA ligase subunit alpha [Candidatus Aegiribacteria sp.]
MAGILKYLADVDTPETLVFGITGRQGKSKSRMMRKFGTDIIAGCTPGKGGQEVDGVPVFNSAAEAVNSFPQLNTAVFFVPAGAVRKAAIDAIDAGLRFLVLTADGVPTQDEIVLKEYASIKDSVYLGPNTVGLLDTSGYLFGLIGGSATWAKKNYKPGKVGVISRSGGLSQLLGAFHCRPNLPGPREDGTFGPLWSEDYPGLSAVVCVGGDPVPGISILDAARAFEKDPRTEVMAIYGETGTSQENDLAEAVRRGEVTKPMVVFLGGKYTKTGVSQSHAGAMKRKEEETWQAKKDILEFSGITVVERPDAVFGAILKALD